MKIIAFMNEKGGVGKTTTSTNFATALHRRGLKVVLVDADPQASARDWREASPEGANLPPVIAFDRPQMMSSIGSLNADIVVIDTPAKAEAMSAAVIRIANVVIMVLQPCGLDVWASAATVKMLQARIDLGGQIDVGFLTNRASANTKLTREIGAGDWNTYNFSQLTATIGNRAVFAQAASDGQSVYDYRNQDAKNDIDAVIAELEAARWL
jgi:chromosome partitioning protein